jgi:predicted nucleic acid-binding protein
MKRVIVDTGPLVALLSASDAHHEWARGVFDTVEPPMFTCEAVISEACFLLRRIKRGQDAVLDLVARDVVTVAFSLASELGAVRRHMERYASVPMSLADACLVRMSELEPRATVVTLDGDFKIYRRNRRQVIPSLLPR